jgi:hypothetical protein
MTGEEMAQAMYIATVVRGNDGRSIEFAEDAWDSLDKRSRDRWIKKAAWVMAVLNGMGYSMGEFMKITEPAEPNLEENGVVRFRSH